MSADGAHFSRPYLNGEQAFVEKLVRTRSKLALRSVYVFMPRKQWKVIAKYHFYISTIPIILFKQFLIINQKILQ